jgi:hypothetical protein
MRLGACMSSLVLVSHALLALAHGIQFYYANRVEEHQGEAR